MKNTYIIKINGFTLSTGGIKETFNLSQASKKAQKVLSDYNKKGQGSPRISIKKI